MIDTSALVAFLAARLDEDERMASAATPGPWRPDDERYVEVIYGGEEQFTSVVAGGRWGGEASPFDRNEDALHIARHDPARVLRDVEAKRRLLAACVLMEPDLTIVTNNPHGFHPGDGTELAGLALALLAAPYSDHPDYRQEWTP